jgi:acylphosphatase
MENDIAVRLLVLGLVQGVGFRAWAAAKAQEHGCSGWVRNLEGGEVEAIVQGNEGAVRAVFDTFRHGPPHARVELLKEEVVVFDRALTNFHVLRTSS